MHAPPHPHPATGLETVAWIADAAQRIGQVAPHMSMTEARHLAGDLRSAWPLLSAREAVSCYFGRSEAPEGPDSEVFELN